MTDNSFVMNVGYMCKAVPAYLPHELLGYARTSLDGTLLSMDILTKIGEEERKEIQSSNSDAAGRRAKYNRGK